MLSWFYLIAQYFASADTLPSALPDALALTITTTSVLAGRSDQVVSSDPKAHLLYRPKQDSGVRTVERVD